MIHRKSSRIPALSLLLALLAATSGRAQSQTPPAAPPPCRETPFREFDFWLGEWDVTMGGQPAGQSRITRLFGDCGLREEWTGAKGGVGTSFNVYDATRKVWHQTWVDNQGGMLLLEGSFRSGAMVLEGSHTVKGTAQNERITWTPNSDGTVRQHWESSTDGGRSWKTAFDGLYRKKK